MTGVLFWEPPIEVHPDILHGIPRDLLKFGADSWRNINQRLSFVGEQGSIGVLNRSALYLRDGTRS